ncbi:tRNA (adenosine(37)-N6)-threonylcarbamoyltransferase complex ATPase subunit type 1 TsaE [Rhodospirillaceae bacterium AH-315-P19]|nr:tRNA (adenosine(37)-N6)-threonylcarbamoyltransferase complex ATPase subunit type 1 TsaE [Rhodospirillaceae bacterium AH-315-P19]
MAENFFPSRIVKLDLPDLAATETLARFVARRVFRGDVIGLGGELGAGKTAFARAFIHARAGGVKEDVPSPTFTLAQIYDLAEFPVWHFDLYRLSKAEDAVELGIEDAFADGVSLIEWPGRLGPLLPWDRLDILLTQGAAADARHAVLVGHGSWAMRLEALEAADALVEFEARAGSDD